MVYYPVGWDTSGLPLVSWAATVVRAAQVVLHDCQAKNEFRGLSDAAACWALRWFRYCTRPESFAESEAAVALYTRSITIGPRRVQLVDAGSAVLNRARWEVTAQI